MAEQIIRTPNGIVIKQTHPAFDAFNYYEPLTSPQDAGTHIQYEGQHYSRVGSKVKDRQPEMERATTIIHEVFPESVAGDKMGGWVMLKHQ